MRYFVRDRYSVDVINRTYFDTQGEAEAWAVSAMREAMGNFEDTYACLEVVGERQIVDPSGKPATVGQWTFSRMTPNWERDDVNVQVLTPRVGIGAGKPVLLQARRNRRRALR